MFALWFVLVQAALAAEPRNVLVLYSNNRLVPGNVAVDRGLRAALASTADRPVQFFSEFLDRPEFSGAAYEETMTSYLRDKYAARPPDAIVAVNDDAVEFLARNRDRLFRSVPIVHASVSQSFLRGLPPLPGDIVGVPMEYDFAGTLALALRLHPGVTRIVVVTGASTRDQGWEARLRREVPPLAGNRQVEFLAEASTADVLHRLGELGDDAVVFTPGYFQDRDGRIFNPRDAAGMMAVASKAPVYGPFDTFLGTGVVGGMMPSFEAMGRQAGTIVDRLFRGDAPASLQLPAIMPTALQVDWRQVRRWRIDNDAIPADAIVHFREPTFWEEYRHLAILAAAIFLLQAMLIASLLLERRRRRSAEQAVQAQRTALAHASRLAVAGELTASIAHEINQPLGAIQTSADAADMILQAGGDRREDLLRIVTRIRRDNLRASDVIRRLRALLAKHEPERVPFDLNDAVGEVGTLLHAEAARRRITLDIVSATAPTWVAGDRTQVQQVLLNLALNAMDAVADLPEDRRTIRVVVVRDVGDAVITVRDRGHGIAPDDLPRLFDSFFSTKKHGMGLGLSIARTIVEAHGGTIRASHNAEGGAEFQVRLPAVDPQAVPAVSA